MRELSGEPECWSLRQATKGWLCLDPRKLWEWGAKLEAGAVAAGDVGGGGGGGWEGGGQSRMRTERSPARAP